MNRICGELCNSSSSKIPTTLEKLTMAIANLTNINDALAERQRLTRVLAEARRAPDLIDALDQTLLERSLAGATTGSIVRDNLIAFGLYDLDDLERCEQYLKMIARSDWLLMSVETKITSDRVSNELKHTEELVVIWWPKKPGFTSSGDRAAGIRGINLGVQLGQPCVTARVINNDWAHARPEISHSQFGCTATTVSSKELADLIGPLNRHVTQDDDQHFAWHAVLLTEGRGLFAWINQHDRSTDIRNFFSMAVKQLKDAMLSWNFEENPPRGLVPPGTVEPDSL